MRLYPALRGLSCGSRGGHVSKSPYKVGVGLAMASGIAPMVPREEHGDPSGVEVLDHRSQPWQRHAVWTVVSGAAVSAANKTTKLSSPPAPLHSSSSLHSSLRPSTPPRPSPIMAVTCGSPCTDQIAPMYPQCRRACFATGRSDSGCPPPGWCTTARASRSPLRRTGPRSRRGTDPPSTGAPRGHTRTCDGRTPIVKCVTHHCMVNTLVHLHFPTTHMSTSEE